MEREPLLPKVKPSSTQPGPEGSEEEVRTSTKLITILKLLFHSNKLPSSIQMVKLLELLQSNLNRSVSDGLLVDGYGSTTNKKGKLTKEGELILIQLKIVLNDLIQLFQFRLVEDSLQALVYHLRLPAPASPAQPTQIPLQPVQSMGMTPIISIITSSDGFHTIVLELIQSFLNLVNGTTTTDELGPGGEGGEKGKGKEADGNSLEGLKEVFIDQFIKILKSIQSNSEYKSFIVSLLDYSQSYFSSLTSSLPFISLEEPSPATTTSPSTLDLVVNLLEPFSNGTLYPFLNSLNVLQDKIKSEEKSFLSLLTNFNLFLSKVLTQEDYLTSSSFHRELISLHTSFLGLISFDQNLKSDLLLFFSNLATLITTILNDPYLLSLSSSLSFLVAACKSWSSLIAKIALGKETIYSDILSYLLPKVLQIVQDLPLPRIEVIREDELDLVIDLPPFFNTSFIPDSINFSTYTSLTILPSSSQHSTSNSALKLLGSENSYKANSIIEIKGLRLESFGLGYYFQYKALPCGLSITDSGLLDLGIGKGEQGGLDLAITLVASSDDDDANEEEGSLWKVETSNLKINNFNLSSHLSHHSILNFFFLPLVQRVLKFELETLINERIKVLAEGVGRFGFRVKELVRLESVRGGEGGREWIKYVKAFWIALVELYPSEPEEVEEDIDFRLTSKGLIIEIEQPTPHPHSSSSSPPPPTTTTLIGLGSQGILLDPSETSTPIPRLSIKEAVVKQSEETLNEIRERKEEVQEVIGEVLEGIQELRTGSDDPRGNENVKGLEGWRSDGFDW